MAGHDSAVPTFGLTQKEAAERLGIYGPNRFRIKTSVDRLKGVLRTLSDPMSIMLAAAAGTYFLLGDPRNGLILLMALVPVLGVDVLLEARSKNALEKLADVLSPRAVVIRDGEERDINAEDLVPGDCLVLREGDRVLADGVLRSCANFSVDESQLTGEAEPRVKKSWVAAELDKPNSEFCFFAGSTILTGQAHGVVSRTGLQTRYGSIVRLVAQSDQSGTPFQKKTSDLVRKLLAVVSVVAVGIWGIGLYHGLSFYSALLSAISFSIAAVPEEFPLVFTLFLSLGAWRLSKQGVLVKRLASVETLGSTTVICVDKTGTLTQGQFQLSSHLSLDHSISENEVLEASVLACELSPADPMEKAILRHARTHGVAVEHFQDQYDLVYDFDFDPIGKHMSHIWRSKKDPRVWRIVAKGALEGILEHCDPSPQERFAANQENDRLASQGYRVLAVAGREGMNFTGLRAQDEKNLKLYGLLAFQDPLRSDVPEAVRLCQQAGIRIKIITGDHLLTAHAIADAAGIAHEPDGLINAPDLEGLSPELFQAKILRGVVFARVKPEQKHAIVETLRRSGEVVAMTGDGINDAPALRQADIGIAMGVQGTEVARASASIVLLSDSFAAITRTIKEGRRIFANIQRSFLFLLAFHIPIVVLAFICPLLGLPAFYLPVHLVWLELIVHPDSALIFEAEPAPLDAMRQKPRDPKAALLDARSVWFSIATGSSLTLAVMGLYLWRLPEGTIHARSLGMATLILGSVFLVWAERAGNKPWWKVPFPKTLRFWAVTLTVVLSLPVIMEVPWLERAFQVVRLSPVDWAWALAAAALSTAWRTFGFFDAQKNDQPAQCHKWE